MNWFKKLWHRDGLPKAVDIPPMPNMPTQSELDMVNGVKPPEQPIEKLIDDASSRHYDLHKARTTVYDTPYLNEAFERIGKALRGPTPEEAAKMKQVREYKRSAFYE